MMIPFLCHNLLLEPSDNLVREIGQRAHRSAAMCDQTAGSISFCCHSLKRKSQATKPRQATARHPVYLVVRPHLL